MVVLALFYAILFATGSRFIIIKTAVVPVFVLYAIALRKRSQFLADWLPLLAATVLFDALRGVIFVGIQHGYPHVYAQYVITLERWLFRTPAVPLVLQRWRTPGLDTLATALHAMHFAFFLLFGLVLWHLRPALFGTYRRTIVLVMAFGIYGYFLVPTVPPWLAADHFGLLPAVPRVLEHMYTVFPREIYGAFDTNPVAAMPSLHAAFPVACALVGQRAYPRPVAFGLWLYALAVIAAVMYLGEHYAVDALAGIGVAIAATAIARRPWVRSPSLALSVSASAAMVVFTVALLLVSR